LSGALSGCVTQNFENGEVPVVQNQANRNDMAATRISLGLGYLRMGNMPLAKQNLEKAKKFSPDMVQVYTAFAHYYETVGEHSQTISSYEKALSLNSADADTLNNYGVYLCRQSQLVAAEKQFLKAIAVPSYLLVYKSYENLASCFLKEDNFTKAEIYLNKAIMHSPSSASILHQMVRLQYAMGEYQQAKHFEQRFEKVTRRFTPQALALAFKVYSKLAQRRIAKNYGAMLVKMYPQSWEAKQYLLNELELIDADNLAKRYQLTQVNLLPQGPKKRIVKLSPKKTPLKAVAPKTATPKNELLPADAQEKNSAKTLSASKPAVIASTATSITTTAEVASVMASSQTISAVLSMSPAITSSNKEETVGTSGNSAAAIVEPLAVEGTGAESTEAESAEAENTVAESTLAEKKTADSKTFKKPTVTARIITVASTAKEQLAPALVQKKAEPIGLVANVTAQGSAIHNEVGSETALTLTNSPVENGLAKSNLAKSAPVKTSSVEQAEIVTMPQVVETPSEDREIFHIAKKPQPIIQNIIEIEPMVTIKPLKKKLVEQVVEKVQPAVHLVGVGDTLFGISIKYNVKIKALRQWNKLSKRKKIRINDKLYVENPTLVTEINE